MKKIIIAVAAIAFASSACGKSKATKEAVAILGELEANANSLATTLGSADSAKAAADAITKYSNSQKEIQGKFANIKGDTTGEMPAAVKEAMDKSKDANMKATQAIVEAGAKYKSDKGFMEALKAVGLDSMVP